MPSKTDMMSAGTYSSSSFPLSIRLISRISFISESRCFEELFILGKPFHGSYGIVNNDGIPKPNFWGFKILSQLYANRLDLPITNEEVEYAVFVEGDKTQILIYTQDFDYEKDEVHDISLSINQVAAKVTKQVIDTSHCNPKGEWIKLGKPDLFTREQVEDVKAKTRLIEEPQEFEIDGVQTNIHLKMHTNDVVLLTLN